MQAARLHQIGAPLQIDTVPTPEPRPTDILVEIKACGVVPNLPNVLANWETWFPHQPLPPLPATFGLDATGIVVAVGSQVVGVSPGERVYINPLRGCGSCRHCRANEPAYCGRAVFQGYFAFGRDTRALFENYPHGGLGQYQTAPQSSVVKIPDNMDFNQAARLGYLGTSYGALMRTGLRPGDTLLINGISGTLGVGAVVLALALGVTRILGVARDRDLLARVKALAPDRIEVFSAEDGSVTDWARGLTDGDGVDAVIDSLGARAPANATLNALMALRKGGTLVLIGGGAEPASMNVKWLMDNSIRVQGSLWFTPAQGQQIADMVRFGVLDMSVFLPKVFPLSEVNNLLAHIDERQGGFTNFVIAP